MLIFFSIQKYSGHLTQFFNVIIQGTLMLFAMQTPIAFYFQPCIETRQTRRDISKEILGFFILFNDHCLNFEAFINIKQFQKTCNLNIFGQSIVIDRYINTPQSIKTTKISFTTNCTHIFTNSLPAPVSQSNLQPLFPDL